MSIDVTAIRLLNLAFCLSDLTCSRGTFVGGMTEDPQVSMGNGIKAPFYVLGVYSSCAVAQLREE